MLPTGGSVHVYAAVSNSCCPLLSHFEYALFSCRLFPDIMCKPNTTPYIKPEVHTASQRRQKRTEPRGTVMSQITLADRQTHTHTHTRTHTDMLITILRSGVGLTTRGKNERCCRVTECDARRQHLNERNAVSSSSSSSSHSGWRTRPSE